MRCSVYLLTMAIALCCMSMTSMAQETVDTSSRYIASKYITAVTAKAHKIERLLDHKTEQALSRFQKEQTKLKRKISKIDSSAANNAFNRAEQEFRNLQSRLGESQQFTQYIPFLDTLKTSLKFIDRHKKLLTSGEGRFSKVEESLTKINSLEQQIQKAEEVRKFLKQQKNVFKEELQSLAYQSS